MLCEEDTETKYSVGPAGQECITQLSPVAGNYSLSLAVIEQGEETNPKTQATLLVCQRALEHIPSTARMFSSNKDRVFLHTSI